MTLVSVVVVVTVVLVAARLWLSQAAVAKLAELDHHKQEKK